MLDPFPRLSGELLGLLHGCCTVVTARIRTRFGKIAVRISAAYLCELRHRVFSEVLKITHLGDLLTLQIYYFDNEHCASQPSGKERVTLWNAPPLSMHLTVLP